MPASWHPARARLDTRRDPSFRAPAPRMQLLHEIVTQHARQWTDRSVAEHADQELHAGTACRGPGKPPQSAWCYSLASWQPLRASEDDLASLIGRSIRTARLAARWKQAELAR